MSSQLIFVTGATGFIGASTALEALKSGYRLRISVRKEAQIETLKEVFAEFIDKVEFVVIPDITVEGAFSKVLDGVDYVLHLASPLASSPDKNQVFPPAIKGTVGILRDASRVSSIKKVVITSSVAALVPLNGTPEGGVISEKTGWDLSVNPDGDFDAGNELMTTFRVYSASKLLSNQATWEFVEKEKPSFAVVTIHPSFVYGHNLIQKSAADLQGSTNGLLFSAIMQGPTNPAVLQSVWVGDVAAAHIKALDSSIPSGSSYLLSGTPYTWKDVAQVVEKNFPGVPHKITADSPSKVEKVDTSKAEKELGITWATTEKVVTEVLSQQLPFFT